MQQTPIQQAIEILEEKRKALKEMDLLGVLLPNEYDYKTEEIMATQLRLSSLLPTEQQYIQQHAEGFAEWVGNEGWVKHRDFKNQWFKLVFLGETPTATTSELYLVYSMYINSLK